MAEYINKKAVLDELERVYNLSDCPAEFYNGYRFAMQIVNSFKKAEVEPVRHGRWIYEAHEEKVNCRWNVTSECSECCDEKNEIWAGFFLGVPSCIAKDAAIENAKGVKLPKFCPNCGARMDLGGADNG